MTDDGRSPPSVLRGRLADVYVPALISGAIEALSRRLGDRSTIDDPHFGRASSLASVEPLLARIAASFAEAGATYEHVSSTAGVDRDASEGRLAMTVGGTTLSLPIAVVAERHRLREIELRVYYAHEEAPDGGNRRAALAPTGELPLAELVDSILTGMRKGDVEQVLAGFEEGSRAVDSAGHAHAKADGGLGRFFADLGELEITLGGCADDGRTVCVEANVRRSPREAAREPAPTMLAFERGDSGLVRELRVY